MKATLFLVLFSLSLVLGQPGGSPLASWAGSLTNWNNTWVSPSTVYGASSCTAGSTNQTYVSFNYVPTATGVSQILVIGDSVNVYLYNGAFSAQNACSNAVAQYTSDSDVYALFDGPNIEAYFLFQANVNYTFVVASTGSAGDFALGVFGANATGNNGNGPTWSPITVSENSPYTCSQAGPSYNASYAKFSWTQPASGLYDITVGFAPYTNATETYWGPYTYIALFNGNVTDSTLTTSSNLCTSLAGQLINAWSESGTLDVHQWGVQLTAGQIYTVVASGSQTDNNANWGVFVAPTRVQQAISLAVGYLQPYYGDTGADCSTTDSSYTNQSFVGNYFTAPAYKVLTTVAYSTSSYLGYSNWTFSQATYGFLYNGSNAGSSTAAPATCTGYVQAWYTWPVSFNTVPGLSYSFVASTTTTTPSNSYLIYSLTGLPVGSVDTSVGGLTSGSTGTGSGQTGSQTLGGQTHTSGTNFTTGLSTTSSSTMVACSFVFVVLAIMAVMF